MLDRSGSMAGEKLEVANRCAVWLVGLLRERDELALVAYDDEVRLLSPLAGSRDGRLAHAISSIRPGGSTNLSGGWLKGFEQPAGTRGRFAEDPAPHRRARRREQLVGVARGASGDGSGTSTIGFGTDFNQDLLTAMADAGGGTAHYAETPDAAPASFAEELEGPDEPRGTEGHARDQPRPDVEMLGVLVPLAVNLVSAAEAKSAEIDLELQEQVLVLKAAQARRQAIRSRTTASTSRPRRCSDIAPTISVPRASRTRRMRWIRQRLGWLRRCTCRAALRARTFATRRGASSGGGGRRPDDRRGSRRGMLQCCGC